MASEPRAGGEQSLQNCEPRGERTEWASAGGVARRATDGPGFGFFFAA